MAEPVGRTEIIAFLVSRRFPPMALAALPSRSRPEAMSLAAIAAIAAKPGGATTLDRVGRHKEIDQYESELASLPSERLQALYEEAHARMAVDLQLEEDARFFNQPHAAADFDHWSKAEHWSLDEAIALAMGKAPEIVCWENIRGFGHGSPFVKRYGRLRDLTARATVWKKLFDPVLPALFLKWAEDNEIAIPAELAERVAKLKGKFSDWKKHYEEMKKSYEDLEKSYEELEKNYDKLNSMYDEHITEWQGVAEKKSVLIESLLQRVGELEGDLASAKQNAAASGSAKAQSPVERQNMLKAIYALAVKGYGYDPTGRRSTIVSEIVSDMTLEGLPLSEDTVRRYLKEARDNLADWKDESR